MIKVSKGKLLALLITIVLMIGMLSGIGICDTLMTPYLQAVTSSSVYVLAECDSTSTAYVDYGLTTSYGSTATTESYAQTTASPATYVHNIKLTALSANTTYHYRVRQGNSTSSDYTFKTAVNEGTNFRFGIVSDTQTGTTVHNAIAQRIKNANPQVLLHGGDLCAETTYSSFKNEFFITNELDLISKTPFFSAPGNHEWGTDPTNAKAFLQFPSSASGTQDYYSFDYGDMHVLVLNNNIAYNVGSDQYNFAKSDIKNSNKKWKVVLCHKPPYAAGGHGENGDMKVMAANIFEPYGVDMVISGHNHFYQHNLVNNIHYFVLGGGGGGLYDPGSAWYTLKSVKDHHYAIVDMTPSTMKMVVYDDDGNVLDTINIAKENTTKFVSHSSTWKYKDTGSDLGTAWRSPSYDDSTWSSGSAILGYGDSEISTTVSYGSDPNNKYITTYFRKTFDVSDPSLYKGMLVRLLRDDGAVIYLNNQEIFRHNMPSGTIYYDTLASSTVEPGVFYENCVDPSILVSGTNVLAVEVHQSAVTSSDLSFDLELIGSTNDRISVTNPGFETGNIDGWTEWHPSGQSACYGVDSYDVHTGNYKCYFWSETAYKQSIHQVKTGLTNGLYTLKAWVKATAYEGAPYYCRMEQLDFGGTNTYTNCNVDAQWRLYKRTIEITNGQLDIGFYVDSPKRTSMQIDDVELVKH